MGKKTKKETVGAGIRKVTRRDFIRTAAGLAAGVASGVYPYSRRGGLAFAQKKTKLLTGRETTVSKTQRSW